VAHPQLAARERWRSVRTSVGPVKALLPPANVDGVDVAMGDVPALGQHTDALLRWLGYGTAEITAMRAQGAI